MSASYFDYAATTPLDARVAEVMEQWQGREAVTGNPSSLHPQGVAARQAIDQASAQVRETLAAQDYQLTWTSGATEANNLAILGSALAIAQRSPTRRRILVTATEHSAVLAAAAATQREGFTLERLPVDACGLIDAQALRATLAEDVALVSTAHVNNETGVCQDLAALAEPIRAVGARWHIDAAQGAGRLPLALSALGADCVSLSAHKFYGPMGVGALLHHPDVRLAPLVHGGGQQAGLRSGTLPTPLIAGMGAAFAYPDNLAERDRQRALHKQLRTAFAALGDVIMNGSAAGSPHVLNVSFAGVHGDALRTQLADVAVGFGSACSSAQGPSHVLRAMGRPDALAHASVRLSLGRFTQPAAVSGVAERIAQTVMALRERSPVWRELCQGRSIEDVYSVTDSLMRA